MPPATTAAAMRAATLCIFCGFPFECAPFKSLRAHGRVLCELNYDAPDDFRAAVLMALATTAIVWVVWTPTLHRTLHRGALRHVTILLFEPADAREITLLLALHCQHGASAATPQKQQSKLESAMRSASAAATRDAAGVRALDAAGRAYTRHSLCLFETRFSKLLNAALRIAREQADAPDFFIGPFMNILTRSATPTPKPLETILDDECTPLAQALHDASLLHSDTIHLSCRRVYRLQMPVRRVRDTLKAAGAKWRSQNWIRAPECEVLPLDDDTITIGDVRNVRAHSVLLMQPATLGVLQLEFTPNTEPIPVIFINDVNNFKDDDIKHLLGGTTARHVCTFTEPLFVRTTVMQRNVITYKHRPGSHRPLPSTI